MSTLLFILLQINWTDVQYTADDFGRTVYSFPVHIRVLLAVTLIFILIVLILLAVVLSSRIFKTGRAIKRDLIRKKYQKILKVLLFEEKPSGKDIDGLFDQADLKNKFTRETILEEIIHLHENFTGETAERLEEIYIRLNFHFDSIKKLKDKRWYIAAKGMRELALMNIRQGLPHVSAFLNSPNEVLRMESRIAVMKLSDKDPLSFLSSKTTLLTGWDTANIYSMLTKIPEKMVPDFSVWLESSNKDVVLFCIQMIGAFHQHVSVGKLINLLKSDDDRICMASVKALRLLNAVDAEKPLLENYPNKNTEIKTEILRTLEAIGSAHSAPLLEKILNQPVEDYSLAIQAVRSLLALGNTGKSIVEQVFQRSGAQMQLIINHAKDNRL